LTITVPANKLLRMVEVVRNKKLPGDFLRNFPSSHRTPVR
jgi:hypothetical protein